MWGARGQAAARGVSWEQTGVSWSKLEQGKQAGSELEQGE